ncbi:autotransporter domain-containing protein [Devosia salina]|uniref:Autotransporter domain-containing protein n=1 Tax=Devosia salina TaxID=2860336 RepID=A0ABX8WJF7_9HYPH|nr:autotransporter domain-containing protein [Devosia salina]QYO77642.1 autotransporter domain-containing protein [Devosia salina]
MSIHETGECDPDRTARTDLVRDSESAGPAANWCRGRLLTTSALCTATLLAFGVPVQAQVTIDNKTDTVIGTGGGTQASPWNIGGPLTVGDLSSGRLDITAGGEVNNTAGFIGLIGGNGTVTVDGTGSTWTNSQDISVGHGGTGSLSITGGGAVSNTFGSVGDVSGSVGTVTVDGAGSTWTNLETLDIGYAGTGTLSVTNGGAVVASGPWNELKYVNIASSSGSTGTLNIGAAAGDAAVGAGKLTAGELWFGSGTGTLNFNHTEDYYEFTVDISGAGTINQLSGVTDLSGDSSGFTGTTYADGGTLLITGQLGGSGGIIGSSAGTTGDVSVLRSGASWTTTTLRVGDQGNGTLTIAGGGTVSSGDAWIGNASGAIGTASVTGAGSSLAASNGVDIGRFGTGTLNILDGATVTAGNDSFIGARSGSNGTVNVSGDGSSFEMGSNDLFAGDEGTGVLNVTEGGEVSTAASYIGDDSGSSGEVTVTGSGSKLTNSDNLVVGFEGNGTLSIAEGGSVTNTYGWIGDATTASGTANVDGDGSIWTNSQTLIVGNSGAGTLNVTVGGAVSSNAGYVGNSTGSDGKVTVDGAGSSWMNASFLTISEIGAGTLDITNGGAVSNTLGFIGSGAGSNGAVTVTGAGSTWTNSANVVVGSIGTGTLTIADDGAVRAGGGSGNVVIANDVDATGTLNIGAAAGDMAAGAGMLDAANVIFGDGDGALVFNHTEGDYDFGAAISGDGAINHLSGTTTLTGDSSGFLGTTNISGGFLRLEGTLGGVLRVNNGALAIDNGGMANSTLDSTIGDDTGDVAFATVTGPGSTWTNANDLFVGDFGTGVLTILDGASVSDNTAYVGKTTDGTGTVTVNGTGSSWDHSSMFSIGYSGEGILKVENGGSVSAEDGYIAYNAGSEGTVTVTGAGSIWDTDATIIGDHGTGRITIADGGALVTTNGYLGAETGTGIATVTGSGSKWTSAQRLVIGDFATGTMTIADGGVVRSDAGIVDLGKELGANGTLNIGAAAGDTAVGAGTLDAEMVQFGQGAGTINFNHTDTDYEFAVDLSRPLGSGTINHLAGVTRLSGDASAFDGTTNVTGGTLYVNNALGGTVNVTGGALGGSGTLGTVAIASGGTVAPGNSIGTLNVGDITIAAGSTYSVEVNSAGQSDLINATGTVTINGGTVTVVPFPDYALDTVYTIVTAAGGMTGTFDAANFGGSSLFITPTLTYDGNNAFVTLGKTTFGAVAMTPNQIAAASGADSLVSGNAVFDAIGVLGTAAQARAAFDAISGEIHASTKTALLEDSRFPREAAMDRLRVTRGGVGADDSAQIEDRFSENSGPWGQGFGSWGPWDSDGNAAVLDRAIGGFLMGGDAVVWENARFGVLGGYSRSNFSVDDRLSSGTADTYTLGVYGGGEWDSFALSGGLAHSWHSLDTSRSAAFTGFTDSLSASYGARTLQAWGEAAYGFETGAVRFEPFANLAHVSLATDGYTESGGAAALSAAANVVSATFATLGLRAETDVSLGELEAKLSGMVGWQHAFGGAPNAQMAFTSGGNAFTIAGVPLAQDSLVFDAGFDVNLTDSATLGFAYGGQLGSGIQNHSASLSLNVKF